MMTHRPPFRPTRRWRAIAPLVVAALLFGLGIPRVPQAGESRLSPWRNLASENQPADASLDSSPGTIHLVSPTPFPEAVHGEDALSLVQKARPTVAYGRGTIVLWSWSPPDFRRQVAKPSSRSQPPLQILLCTWLA